MAVSAGGILTASGKPKSFKTFFISALAGAFLKGEYMGISTPNADDYSKVLLCDTEQGRARTQTIIKRIQAITGFDSEEIDERLVTLSVRELSPSERVKAIFNAIGAVNPKLVVIDGIRDLIKDFNSIEESVDIVNQIMKSATDYNCAVVVVIHLNKGDDNIRGHLGSELSNKSETLIKLSTDSSGAVKVTPTLCRDIAFEEFAFRISENGLPVLCGSLPNTEDKDEKKRAQIKDMLIQIFGDNEILCKKDLVNALAPIIEASPKTAQRRIDDAVEYNILTALPNKSYQLIK